MALATYDPNRFGRCDVTPEAVRSVHDRIVGHCDPRVAEELTEMLGLLPHLHATEPVVLT